MFNLSNRITKLSIGCLLVLNLACQVSIGQGLGNAPYSGLGIGEQYSNGFGPNMAMGDVGVSNANGFHINPLNPALTAYNRYTMFDIGLMGQYKRLQDKRQTQQEFGGNLGYIAMAFPVTQKWGLGIGIRPLTYVDYQQNSYSKISNTIYEAQYQYQGKGSLNQVYLSNGFYLNKSLSVGVEASYLFGGANRSATTQVRIGDDRDYFVRRDDRLKYSEINLKLGAAYKQKLSGNNFLNFGLVYEPKFQLEGSRTSTLEINNPSGASISAPDTLQYVATNLKVPSTMRFGISYEKPYNLLLAFDFKSQAWSQYSGLAKTNEGFRDSQSYHFGLEYMPRSSSTKYWDIVWYRAGFVYNKTPIMLGGVAVDDISGSLGMSLPIGQGRVNTINLSVVMGSKGTITDQTFRERYVRFVLGFSLKDTWFRKFQVD
jgi:hypothetical protein